MSITKADLDSIKVLFRRDDTLELFGVPYHMRSGQSPKDIFRAGNTRGKWVWLGGPGWWGNLKNGERALVKAFLAKHHDDVPTGPNEWSTLPDDGDLSGSSRRGSFMRVPGAKGRGLGHFTPGDYYVYMAPAELVTTRSTQADGITEAKRQRQLWVEAGAPRTPHYFVSYNPNGKRVWSSKEDPGLSGVRTMNDSEREQWVQNDEGLYNWWKGSRMSMREFVRSNRAELTEAINKVLNKPPHEKTWRNY